MSEETADDGRTAVVVGGGIGGLAAAAALSARGWKVELLERAAAFEALGAGLSLWPNALRALDALGAGAQVRAKALVETEGGIRTPSGRWLSRTDTAELNRRYGPLVMIHRADLHDILREAARRATLTPGTEVTGVRTNGDAAEVERTGGVLRADLVVGADGIRSAVRRSLWPDAPGPRYAGYTAWRLLAEPDDHLARSSGERPPDPQGRRSGDPRSAELRCGHLTYGGETWGRGERFGIAPLPDGRVYCFGVASVPAGLRSPDGELAELRRRFGGWHDPIPALLAATPAEAVLRHDIEELPPLATFVSGRVALLGDAAHAMTPNMGQGACQALEDAVTLAALLDAHPTVEAALAAYDAERRPRTQKIALRSRRIGEVAQWSSAPAAALRDAVMRLTPASSILRALGPVLSWTPPA